VLKKSTSWSVLIYGALLICLGYWGFHQSQSKVSLFMGLGSGVLLILSSLAMFAHKKWGCYTALGLTLMMTITFALRYSTTAKMIPAVLSVLSGGMLLFLLALTAKWKKS
jgi:uncharacterized membrane protein (UPF0136 family)